MYRDNTVCEIIALSLQILLLIPRMKIVWKLVSIWWSYKAYNKVCKILGPSCI